MSKIILETSGRSLFIKDRGIPKGCELCLKGAKTVLFLNGICQLPEHCSWYCPISHKRKGKSLTYANEINILNNNDLLKEIKKANSEGISITGGEPLNPHNLKKTLKYIEFLKEEMGENFHIHLYTNSMNFSPVIAEQLEAAGLDEIRFHPPRNKWNSIEYALNTDMSVGAEVPLIPQNDYIKKLTQFILYIDSLKADFTNLNEFEYCFTNSERLKKRGFELEKGTLASVKGSKESINNLFKDLNERTSLKIHFCKIITKDFYQLKNRYLRRAKNIKNEYEEITEEGLLLYAELIGKEEDLYNFQDYLFQTAQVPEDLLVFENNILKMPFYIAIEEDITTLYKKFNLEAFIVETTPFRKSPARQITERTPMKIFKEEYEFFEDEN